ncbi:CRISPR-associated protein Csx20 [Campylobacter concisus]
MKTLFILMNHALTPEQEEDARENLKIEKFANIADAKWSDIDPFEKSVVNVINIYKDRLTGQASAGDVLLVQGDFGATYNMIKFRKKYGLNRRICYYKAYSKRIYRKRKSRNKTRI